MEKQFVAMKAFIIDEANDTIFLMHKGTKDMLNPGKWEVPGGKMEIKNNRQILVNIYGCTKENMPFFI